MANPSHDDSGPAKSKHRLTCPQCKARYRTPRPTGGRRVRCHHCGHVWRDEKESLHGLSGALSQAASAWSELGSTAIGAADHASTVGRLVSKGVASRRPPASEWIGKQLGRYKIKAVLGQGAMGYVYEAFDTDLTRTVALKILPPPRNAAASALGRRMFLQEARIAAKLQHPNIVTIHEVGEDGGTNFFAMECVRGLTLLQLIKQRGPLPADQACYIIAHAARALAAGHALGVIHRDVKPGNIMLDTAGRVKVTDFGLADVPTAGLTPDSPDADDDRPPDNSDDSEASGLERIEELSERTIGTPGWISPDVARGEQATAASDIYGLGLTLYFVLTGERLITASSKQAMIESQRHAKSVRRQDLPQDWPPRLADVVVQALQADPQDRYQSADTLAADLLRALRPDERDATLILEPLPPEAPGHVSPILTWIALGLLFAAASMVAGWYYFLR